MAKKKSSNKKSTKNTKKRKAPKARKKIVSKKTGKKPAPKKSAARKAPAKSKQAKGKLASAKTIRAKSFSPKKRPIERRIRGKADIVDGLELQPRGLGPNSGGQSGDLQGLSDVSEADSESVSELLEEGQSYEAEVVQGVENARDADRGPVRTHEVPEDDVPEEYRKTGATF